METSDKIINRREVIKKTAKTGAFILPTMLSFTVSELHAASSGANPFPDEPEKPASKK